MKKPPRPMYWELLENAPGPTWPVGCAKAITQNGLTCRRLWPLAGPKSRSLCTHCKRLAEKAAA